MPIRRRGFYQRRRSIRKWATHQTAVKQTLSQTAFTQSNAIVVPALTTGQFSRVCSSIKFQIAGDSESDITKTIGWALQYVPASAQPQALGFNQTESGDLVSSNQYILGCGVFQSNNAPNAFYGKGCKLNDGDQVYLSIMPLSNTPQTENIIIFNAVFKYSISTI